MSESTDPMELVTVYTVSNPTEAEILKLALENESIEAEVSGEHQAGFTGTLRIDILVRAGDAERARAFIQEHEERRQRERDQKQD